MPTIDEALARFLHRYPTASYRRDAGGTGVVRHLRGDFEVLARLDPGAFDPAPLIAGIEAFWREWRVLFDPSADGANAQLRYPFALAGASAAMATVRAQQFERASGTEIDISGAILTARIAARRPDDHSKQVAWQHDGIDNRLVADPGRTDIAVALTDKEAAAAACRYVFGRTDLAFVKPALLSRRFAASAEAERCWRVPVPAQPGIAGRSWARGALIYWPDDAGATRPLHIEPDGSYAQPLAGNDGVYQKGCTLWVTPSGRRFELVDDTHAAPGGTTIRTGTLMPVAAAANSNVTVVPLKAGSEGWHDDGSKKPDNPGVGADAHAAARMAVDYFLSLKQQARLLGSRPILPDPLNVAVGVFPAAQPGEWRKSTKTAVIANPDWNLPPSWLKRWDFCCSDDVVAHEIAHGVLNERCVFDYSLESGAVEEGLADVFAVLATAPRPNAEAIFEGPWMREDTVVVHAVGWLRSATWDRPLSTAPLGPNDRVERGDYPNHYAQFARLAATNAQAARRSKPRNDHGYIHWNSAILTRALAMLARPDGTRIANPETRLEAVAIGRDAVGELSLVALLNDLDGSYFTNLDGEDTPMARLRAALLSVATSAQFDDTAPRRLYAAQLLNALNAAGIGPMLSMRGRPAGVRSDLMPSPPAISPLVIRQGGRLPVVWRFGDAEPVALVRTEDLSVEAHALNLGVSTDLAFPEVTVLVETRRVNGEPKDFKAYDLAASPPTTAGLRPGQGRDFGPLSIARGDLPANLSDPWLAVVVSDQSNRMRTLSTLRAAVADPGYPLPLNAVLVRLQLA